MSRTLDISYPLLLDGGLSNELESQGHRLETDLWASQLLVSAPEAIVQAHLAYLEAGARCILTASYQASFPGLQKLGYSFSQAKQIILKSVELAQRAIAIYHQTKRDSPKILIGASIGPYGAYLANGAEYTGNYGVSDEVLIHFHTKKIELLDLSKVDILVLETIPSFQEAVILKRLLNKVEKPVWVSFSCQDGQRINDGTHFSECIKLFSHHPKIEAIGINCTAPSYISSLLTILKELAPNKKALIYPNSGETYHAGSKTWSGESPPQSCTALAQEWLSLGADIIGGCCRMGPEHIKAMAKVLVEG